ncbi:protein abrupt-like [Tribolium madens]|uniref:protein abrupt-like n=1 Tax=Tribolium madens TaxID=41895 RepID=UPI001CF72DDF|nr:protein abrupt-like [Tribolium madens]
MNAGLYSDGAQIQKFNFEDELNRQLLDFEIICGDGSVCGHKIILTSRSPYFRHLVESQPGIGEVTFADFGREPMKKALQLIYGETVRVAELQVDEFLKILHVLRVDYWVKFNRMRMDRVDIAAMSSASTPDISTETEVSASEDLGSRRSGDGESIALND